MKGGTEHWNAWGKYLAITGAYAVCFNLAFSLSSSHWQLTAGLRLGCLLLIPKRYWPSLAIGEFIPLLENALICMSKFGAAWSLAASVPPIVLYMAWIDPMRRHGSLYSADGHLCMRYLLTAALCCAITSALRDTSAVLVILTGTYYTGPNIPLFMSFSSYMLGAYLGVLTVVPIILALRERALSRPPSMTVLWHSKLFQDTATWAIPAGAGLAWLANASPDGMPQQAARLAMILPILLMAYRHGWHGTALAGGGASIAMAMTSHVVRDPAVIHCQVALAFALSTALWWGGRASQRFALPVHRSEENA